MGIQAGAANNGNFWNNGSTAVGGGWQAAAGASRLNAGYSFDKYMGIELGILVLHHLEAHIAIVVALHSQMFHLLVLYR